MCCAVGSAEKLIAMPTPKEIIKQDCQGPICGDGDECCPNTPGLSGFWNQSQADSALYIAFWSVEPTDFKNVIVENIHWALSL